MLWIITRFLNTFTVEIMYICLLCTYIYIYMPRSHYIHIFIVNESEEYEDKWQEQELIYKGKNSISFINDIRSYFIIYFIDFEFEREKNNLITAFRFNLKWKTTENSLFNDILLLFLVAFLNLVHCDHNYFPHIAGYMWTREYL